jgi:hypothetical protein
MFSISIGYGKKQDQITIKKGTLGGVYLLGLPIPQFMVIQ